MCSERFLLPGLPTAFRVACSTTGIHTHAIAPTPPLDMRRARGTRESAAHIASAVVCRRGLLALWYLIRRRRRGLQALRVAHDGLVRSVGR